MADANGHIPPEELLETTWDGDRMYILSSLLSWRECWLTPVWRLCRFNIYIHDYCVKHGYILTARALMQEAQIQDAALPPINAKQGLLFE